MGGTPAVHDTPRDSSRGGHLEPTSASWKASMAAGRVAVDGAGGVAAAAVGLVWGFVRSAASPHSPPVCKKSPRLVSWPAGMRHAKPRPTNPAGMRHAKPRPTKS